ncbi:MAG: NAD(P)H-dependent oxidoreductase [Cryomorphaceae bacterium]
MKVLIVHAHPEPHSFSSALKDQAVAHFESQGHEVAVSDLYAMAFDPVGSERDFTRLKNASNFKYQAEQVHAYHNDLYVSTLKTEMEKVHSSDLIIFNFPLWWFGLPAILKGWVDRVFAMGFIYGAGKGIYEDGIYQDKRAFISMTTGGPQPAFGDEGAEGEFEKILFPIQFGMFHFVGMTVLPPFISFGPARKSDSERSDDLQRYSNYLTNIDQHEPIYQVINEDE